MTEQELKDLKYLWHAVRNATTAIEGCMREVRQYLRLIETAVTAYSEELLDEHGMDKTGSEGKTKPTYP